MKSFFSIIVFLCCFHTIQAQKKNPHKITLDFKELTSLEVIQKIEAQTTYRFFFLESWLDTKKHTGSYKNALLTNVLEALFKETLVNYHLTENNQIVLTKNVFIHKAALPAIFDTNHTTKKNTTIQAPILVENEQSTSTNTADNRIYRIGKEIENSQNISNTLSGFVYEKNTNKPISDIVVRINNKNVVTDSLGFYSFKLTSGAYTVKTLGIGIQNQSKKIILYNTGTLNFYLEDSSQTLEEVVINFEADKNIKEVTAGITQIKVEAIKTIPLVLGERDILKVAATLPGIKTAGEGAMGYSVRGGKTDQNLIMLDEGVVYNPTHFFGLFSAVNPFTTGTVKIYKGSAPAEYGGRLSSVFDINTKSASDTTFKGEASIGPVTSNITLEIPIKKEQSSLIVGARGTYSNWMLKVIKNKSLNNSNASFFDAIGKYKHQFNENNALSIAGYYSTDNYSIASDTTNTYQNKILSATWSHKFNDKSKGDLIVSNSGYLFDIDFDGKLDRNFYINYNINEYNLKLKMIYEYSKESFT